jgi:tetratricopeptide (TPR) repeat protein
MRLFRRSYLVPGLFLSLCLAQDGHFHSPASDEQLGSVSFPISCPAAAQSSFERGVALMHSFSYASAEKQFHDLEAKQPDCAMAYWGEAMSLMRQLVSVPEPADMQRGAELLHKAQALAPKTQREQDYVHAAALFYAATKEEYKIRARHYSSAMEAIYRRYPEDQQAADFYAVSLMNWGEPDDPLANARRAIAILVPVFQKNPNDPGAAHYLIHAADVPQLAPLGLPAARHYAQIAPSVPHALHMPSHIFARLGLWQEDIASNLASLASARDPATHVGAENQIHAMEFLEYAYLQTGEDAKAAAIISQFQRVSRDDVTDVLRSPYYDRTITIFPAMYALERHDWKRALALQPPPEAEPFNQSLAFWARAVAAGHLRDASAAQDAVAHYDALLEATKKSSHSYVVPHMATNHDEAHAWMAFAQGDNDEAIRLLNSVAGKQDIEGKGEIELPAREMLADMLREMGRPQQALAEYERSLKVDPNRFNGLVGAALAAQTLHQTEKARIEYTQLLKNCDNGAHSNRPELTAAKAFLMRH